MNYSDQIGELLNKINKPVTPYQKQAQVCRVRNNGSNKLLFHVEPIDSPNFDSTTAWEETRDSDGNLDKPKQVMSNKQLQASMNNWIFDVSVNADPSITITAGKWDLPALDSFVIIEWLNDTDAYISLTSKISETYIKLEDDSEISIKPSQMAVNVTKYDVELLISDLIKLRNGENSIEVTEDGLFIIGGNPNRDILIQTESFSSTGVGATGAILKLNGSNDKITIKNNDASLKDILNEMMTATNDLVTALLTLIDGGVTTPSGAGVFTNSLAFGSTSSNISKRLTQSLIDSVALLED